LNALLQVSGLDFSYTPDRPILQNVRFTMNEGELLTVIGPNGAGKSTLLSCIIGLLPTAAGIVRLRGAPLTAYTPRDIARLAAYVPQMSDAMYAYPVREYIAMGRAPHLRTTQLPGAEDMRIVDGAIARMGIEYLANKAYTKLSGGERQLVNICRALAQQPALILFDEPTSALDYGNQIKTLKMVRSLSEEGYAIIMTTHNPDHAIMLGGSVGVVDRSGRFDVGKTRDAINEKRLSEIYQTNVMIEFVPRAGRDVCMPASLND
jgi:iron complex transport system ATP-binding protein